MIWGKGDRSGLDDETLETLNQLHRLVESGHIIALNDTQAAVLLRAIRSYADWEGTLRTLSHIRNVMGLMAFFFVSWWVTDGKPIEALLGLLQ